MQHLTQTESLERKVPSQIQDTDLARRRLQPCLTLSYITVHNG